MYDKELNKLIKNQIKQYRYEREEYSNKVLYDFFDICVQFEDYNYVN